MIELIRSSELKERKELAESDKNLIEKYVTEFGGDYSTPPDTLKKRAIRGFLVQQTKDEALNDDLREDWPYDAACFAEGWDAAVKEARQWLTTTEILLDPLR